MAGGYCVAVAAAAAAAAAAAESAAGGAAADTLVADNYSRAHSGKTPAAGHAVSPQYSSSDRRVACSTHSQ